jgi:hypothetical protein
MKKILVFLFSINSYFMFGQSVTADPALEPMKITSLNNITFSSSQIPLDNILKLKVPILNKNIVNGIPDGTCKIKIGLGSKLILDPNFDLSTVNTSTYFKWTSINSGGQIQITGELISALPFNFSDTAVFNLKGLILGASTITSNFLVTNHNSNILLSDEDGTNNIASTPYIIVTSASLPLTLTNFSITSVDCKPNLKWVTQNEINTSHFEIEKSTDGINWIKIGTKNASGNSTSPINYSFTDDAIQNNEDKLFYKIKMIDKDGSFKYSSVFKIINNCNKMQLSIYPNPVINNKINFAIAGFENRVFAILKLSSGAVLGKYSINNGTNSIDVSKLSNGFYILTIIDNNGNTLQAKAIIQK